MAHSVRVKAQAFALLLTGNSTRYVAEQTGVPRRTVRRWAVQEAYPLMRECVALALQKRGESLPRINQNGPKKETRNDEPAT